MAAKGIYDTVKQAIQDVVAPDLERIKGQLTGVDARLGAVEKRVDEGLTGVRAELKADLSAVRAELKADLSAVRAEIRGMDDRLGSFRNEMHAELRSVNARMDALKDRFAEALNCASAMGSPHKGMAAI